jgi:hypothetical protein
MEVKKMSTRLTKGLLVGMILTLFAVPVSVLAEEDKPTASADLSVLSQYIWRGYELSKDSAVIQPSMTVAYKGFSANFWGNMDTNVSYDSPFRDESKWTETDWTLAYNKSLGMVGVGVGYIYYALDSLTDSQEIFASVKLDTLLSPTLTVFREVSHTPAWYFLFGISHSFKVYNDVTLDLAGSVSYYYYNDNSVTEANSTKTYRDFHNGLISAGLTIPLGKYFNVKPLVAYSFPLSDTADDFLTAASYSNKSDFFYGGVTVSFAF